MVPPYTPFFCQLDTISGERKRTVERHKAADWQGFAANFRTSTNRSNRSDQTYRDVEVEGIGRRRDASQNALKLKEKLEGCRDLVPGTLQIDVGVATPGLDATADIVLVSDFADKAALDAYQVHPVHQEVKKFVVAVAESRECVDYIVDNAR